MRQWLNRVEKSKQSKFSKLYCNIVLDNFQDGHQWIRLLVNVAGSCVIVSPLIFSSLYPKLVLLWLFVFAILFLLFGSICLTKMDKQILQYARKQLMKFISRGKSKNTELELKRKITIGKDTLPLNWILITLAMTLISSAAIIVGKYFFYQELQLSKEYIAFGLATLSLFILIVNIFPNYIYYADLACEYEYICKDLKFNLIVNKKDNLVGDVKEMNNLNHKEKKKSKRISFSLSNVKFKIITGTVSALLFLCVFYKVDLIENICELGYHFTILLVTAFLLLLLFLFTEVK